MALAAEHRRSRREVVRRATEDELTGLRTRRSAFTVLERELRRSERTGRAFCVLMLDLDDLKGINDRHGHMAGDAALRAVGEAIGSRIRRVDIGARFGGDEFVVLLPETDPTGGWVVAEQIRRAVKETALEVDGVRVPLSASVGIVSYPHDGTTVGGLLECADEAMYRSKRGGRDRVSGVPDSTEGQPAPVPASSFRIESAAAPAANRGVSGDPV
jgi:diguanylate cyclase (GGDEF)-like protein